MPKRIVVGISGASGVIYGVRLLSLLKESDHETHLIISKSGKLNIEIETKYSPDEVAAMADYVYDDKIFDYLNIEHDLFRRWGDGAASPEKHDSSLKVI